MRTRFTSPVLKRLARQVVQEALDGELQRDQVQRHAETAALVWELPRRLRGGFARAVLGKWTRATSPV